jgi:predicted transposase YdaD
MQALVDCGPQKFVDFLVPGGKFVKERRLKVKGIAYEVDALLEVEIGGWIYLIQVEFQTKKDPLMRERMLAYNVGVRLEHGVPVISVVFHLMRDGKIHESPLKWDGPGIIGLPEVLSFHFLCIEVGHFEAKEILASGPFILLPFVPLMKGGNTLEVTERMLTTLNPAENREMAVVAMAFIAQVFKQKQDELNWLIRRVAMLDDFFDDDNVVIQYIQQRGLAKGLVQGREEGEKKGEQKGKQGDIFALVGARFPDLLTLAKKQVTKVEKPDVLTQLIVQIGVAQNATEAEQALRAIPQEALRKTPSRRRASTSKTSRQPSL